MENQDATLQNIIDKTSLRWIFVGGKGGVGKTTCSCSLALQLAKHREKVLLISTDPAHNVSDAFDQSIGKTPTQINACPNLYAMEIDPQINIDELEVNFLAPDDAADRKQFRRLITDWMSKFPGIDEYMSYTEVFRLVISMDYSTIVFDTAPTGHTLRLLAFPEMMESSLEKIMSLQSKFSPIFNSLGSFFGLSGGSGGGGIGGGAVESGGGGGGADEGAAGSASASSSGNPMDLAKEISSRLPIVKQITSQFKDPAQTTFVCVCIPEFLSVYETERLINELWTQTINVENLIVNQILTVPQSQCPKCESCEARKKIQKKYIEQIDELYAEFHIVKMPWLPCEVRGYKQIEQFSRHLLVPFDVANNVVTVEAKSGDANAAS